MCVSMEKIRAGAVQPELVSGDIPFNLSCVVERLHYLGKKGTHISLLPELWSCGFDNEALPRHAEKTPGILEELSKIAADYRMIIGGSLPEKAGKTIYNTFYLHDADGHLAGQYRKVHLFTLSGEERYFGRGNEAILCETKVGSVGLMICYDLRFPELCRFLTVKGARIILVAAQWPEQRIGHWDTLLKARAIENQVVVIAANRRGQDDMNRFRGHSQILSPLGEVIGFAGSEDWGAEGEIDLSEISRVRAAMPCLLERRLDLYEK